MTNQPHLQTAHLGERELNRFQAYYENMGHSHPCDRGTSAKRHLSSSEFLRNAGWIYVLSNPAMPGLVKIGRTCRSVERRIKELETTGVPYSFTLELKWFVPDAIEAEEYLHETYRPYRLTRAREFFTIDVSEVHVALMGIDTRHNGYAVPPEHYSEWLSVSSSKGFYRHGRKSIFEEMDEMLGGDS